jgi:hypothetical protein
MYFLTSDQTETVCIIVITVKPHNLHSINLSKQPKNLQRNSNSFLPEPLFIINSLSAEFVSVQLGLYNSAPIAYCVSGRLIPLSIDGTQQFLILGDLPPGAMRLLSAGDGYKKLVRLLFSNDQSPLYRPKQAGSKYINHSWDTTLYCNITLT